MSALPSRSLTKAIACRQGDGATATVATAVSDFPPFARVAMIPVLPPPPAVTRPALSTVATHPEPLLHANAAPTTG